METCADLQKRAYTTMGTDSAGRRTGDAGKEFQEGRFAGAVLADDADDVALLDLEVDIAQRPYVLGVTFGGAVVGFAYLKIGIFFASNAGKPPAADVVGQGLGRDQAEAVLFGYVIEFYCCCHSFINFLFCL